MPARFPKVCLVLSRITADRRCAASNTARGILPHTRRRELRGDRPEGGRPLMSARRRGLGLLRHRGGRWSGPLAPPQGATKDVGCTIPGSARLGEKSPQGLRWGSRGPRRILVHCVLDSTELRGRRSARKERKPAAPKGTTPNRRRLCGGFQFLVAFLRAVGPCREFSPSARGAKRKNVGVGSWT